MKNQVTKLQLARDRVQHSIDAAINNCEEIEGDVNKWLEEVDKNTEKAMKVLESEGEARRKYSNGLCLNLSLRHRLSHKAAKIVEDIDEVLKNGNFGSVSHRQAPKAIMITSHVDYVASESRKSVMKRLMESLKDDNIHVIGVWGMPGVGKTTLVREVAIQAMKERLFDKVAMADVTQSPDVRRIQGEIADMLDLKFDKETEPGRASILRERLSKDKKKHVIFEDVDGIMKKPDSGASHLQGRLTETKDQKILVILDNIWENLDLEAIGIPSKGCKVLLTSRNRVLFCAMGTQKDFELKVLREEEAWSLFEKMAGDCVKEPYLRSIATQVAKECACLPLALVTVSKALNNKSLEEWKDALQLLRRPVSENITKSIYSSIEVSYKHLEGEVQEVFLLCAQLGDYIVEMDLLKYCYGLGVFQGVNTMEDARNRLYTRLRILKDYCLLLDSPYSSECLRMHDVVRDAAQLIESRDPKTFKVRADGRLKEGPNADALKRYGSFSTSGGDMHEVFSNLRTLLMYGPLPIPDTLFERMGKLKVLDLTKMQLSSLPSSLPLLLNLKTLCLDYCVLGDISMIGELKHLVILSLLHSDISQLPREIGLLTRLRLLDLSNCSKLE